MGIIIDPNPNMDFDGEYTRFRNSIISLRERVIWDYPSC